MFPLTKNTFGEGLILFGKVLFFGFFWMNKGIYMGGKELFFGVYMPLLEVILPWSALGILCIFFGTFFARKQTFLTWQQFTYLLILLGLFIIQSIGSIDPNMSVLFFPLFIIAVLTTVLDEEVNIMSQKNLAWLGGGLCLGLVFQLIHPDLVVSALLAFGGLIFWTTLVLTNKVSPKQQILFAIGVCILLFLSHSWMSIMAFLLLIFGAKTWIPRSQKQSRPLQGIILSIVLLTGILGVLTDQWDINIPEKTSSISLWSWGNLFTGVGQGQYLPAIQHYANQFLVPEQLTLPHTAITLWFKEWGIVGILFSLLLFMWSKKWGKMPPICLIITVLFCLFAIEFVTTEVGLLCWLVLFLQRTKRKRVE